MREGGRVSVGYFLRRLNVHVGIPCTRVPESEASNSPRCLKWLASFPANLPNIPSLTSPSYFSFSVFSRAFQQLRHVGRNLALLFQFFWRLVHPVFLLVSKLSAILDWALSGFEASFVHWNSSHSAFTRTLSGFGKLLSPVQQQLEVLFAAWRTVCRYTCRGMWEIHWKYLCCRLLAILVTAARVLIAPFAAVYFLWQLTSSRDANSNNSNVRDDDTTETQTETAPRNNAVQNSVVSQSNTLK